MLRLDPRELALLEHLPERVLVAVRVRREEHLVVIALRPAQAAQQRLDILARNLVRLVDPDPRILAGALARFEVDPANDDLGVSDLVEVNVIALASSERFWARLLKHGFERDKRRVTHARASLANHEAA